MVELNGTLLIQIINFVILCAILGHFCYKPVLKVLDERKNRIKNDLDSAAASKADAEKLKESYEEQLRDAQAKAQEIVDKAVKQADKEAQAQLDAIRSQIAREKEIAQAEIANEREAAIREMRNEVVTLSMAVAEKLLKKNMDTDMNQKLVAECLKQFDGQQPAGKKS